jgi:hypothetical protein
MARRRRLQQGLAAKEMIPEESFGILIVFECSAMRFLFVPAIGFVIDSVVPSLGELLLKNARPLV